MMTDTTSSKLLQLVVYLPCLLTNVIEICTANGIFPTVKEEKYISIEEIPLVCLYLLLLLFLVLFSFYLILIYFNYLRSQHWFNESKLE